MLPLCLLVSALEGYFILGLQTPREIFLTGQDCSGNVCLNILYDICGQPQQVLPQISGCIHDKNLAQLLAAVRQTTLDCTSSSLKRSDLRWKDNECSDSLSPDHSVREVAVQTLAVCFQRAEGAVPDYSAAESHLEQIGGGVNGEFPN